MIPIISSVYITSSATNGSIFGLYDEMTPVWYKEIGYGILVGSFTRIIILAFVGVARYVSYKLLIYFDTK